MPPERQDPTSQPPPEPTKDVRDMTPQEFGRHLAMLRKQENEQEQRQRALADRWDGTTYDPPPP